MRDLTSQFMSEVCHDASIEPHLQPVTREALVSYPLVVSSERNVDNSAKRKKENQLICMMISQQQNMTSEILLQF